MGVGYSQLISNCDPCSSTWWVRWERLGPVSSHGHCSRAWWILIWFLFPFLSSGENNVILMVRVWGFRKIKMFFLKKIYFIIKRRKQENSQVYILMVIYVIQWTSALVSNNADTFFGKWYLCAFSLFSNALHCSVVIFFPSSHLHSWEQGIYHSLIWRKIWQWND